MKPKKSALQKRIDNPKSSYWMKKADWAWGDLMHTVYKTCAIGDTVPQATCAGDLQAHHLINRKHMATRHSIWNCAGLLCAKHHQWSIYLSAHFAPLAFAAWLMKHRPQHWSWVEKHKWDIGKPDFKAIYENLIKIKEDYERKHPSVVKA